MSTGKRILPFYSVITNGSMTGNLTSLTTNIQNMDVIGYQISWTGTPVGTLTINVSGDNVTFEPLQNFAINSPNGSAGGTWVDVAETAATYIQLIYTATSSTGTLNAKVGGKAF